MPITYNGGTPSERFKFLAINKGLQFIAKGVLVEWGSAEFE